MIKVKSKVIETAPKPITCDSCGAELEYEDSDLKVGLWGHKGFECPECGDFVFCSDRVSEPIYPLTFYKPKNPVELQDHEVNELLRDVIAKLKNCEVGEFSFCSTGDTTVIGLKFEDEDDYYVCRRAEEDSVYYNEGRD